MNPLPSLLLLAGQAGAVTDDRPASPVYERVLLISVDGLRSDALEGPYREKLPGFQRFLEHGASTLNARTDPDFTNTLPNHTSMLTGRLVLGDDGHAWTENDDPEKGSTLHGNKGDYLASVFDVASDREVGTVLLAGKSKFRLFDTSWDDEHGAPDRSSPDSGRDKLDRFLVIDELEEITSKALEALDSGERQLVFVHYAAPDHAGHSSGWDLSPDSRYVKAVRAIDRELARLLEELGDDGSTAIVLTADHGGGASKRDHSDAEERLNYRIPFLVWTGADDRARDLYELNESSRADPGAAQHASDAPGPPPIRNGDAANLALDLLGLPPVPGSTINPRQDLRVH